MKPEERHELEQNDLASWLRYGLWAFLKQNGSYILLVVALAFLGYRLWRLYEDRQEAYRIGAWAELNSAHNSEDPPRKYLEILDKYSITPIQAQAYLGLGEFYLRIVALPEYMDQRKQSRSECLDKALDAFNNALKIKPDDRLIAFKARLGIASVYEDKEQWDKARAEYETILNKQGMFAGTPFVIIAEERINTLNDRRQAPRLVTMIPPPKRETPPDLLGNTDRSLFPGMFNNPQEPVNTSPATQPSPLPTIPFQGPSIPGINPGLTFPEPAGPILPSVPATMPAGTLVPDVPGTTTAD